MPFKLSRCICLATDQHDRAISFYRDLIGLETIQEKAGSVEFKAEPYRFYVDHADAHGGGHGMVFELIVPDLETARKELTEAGCEVIRWEGKGRDCYVRDPFGAIFNLWEDPDAF